MLARKTVSKKPLHEEHRSQIYWMKMTVNRLPYELGLTLEYYEK